MKTTALKTVLFMCGFLNPADLAKEVLNHLPVCRLATATKHGLRLSVSLCDLLTIISAAHQVSAVFATSNVLHMSEDVVFFFMGARLIKKKKKQPYAALLHESKPEPISPLSKLLSFIIKKRKKNRGEN